MGATPALGRGFLKFQSMELSPGIGDSDRRLVRLGHPRRDRGDTGIGRAAKAA
jgi:hypothetical protein